MEIRALSYVAIEAQDIEAWADFGPKVLGMPVTRPEGEADRILLRMDERSYRLDVRAGASDRLTALGWELSTRAALTGAEEEFLGKGVVVERATPEQCRAKGVAGMVWFDDPAGNRCELFYGQEADFRPLALSRPMAGYVTDELGMGHAVIGVTNYEQCLDFYLDVLGFRVSDTYKDFIAFLHCNPRHHSLALVGTERPGLRHIMLETQALDDVGLAMDIVKQRGELSRTLGRHTNDKAVSFYIRTPSGWEIEYGWSGMQVDDEVWIVRQLAGPTSLWGHEVLSAEKH